MKKNIVVGIAMAIGMLSVGALSASAAEANSNMVTCVDKQAHLQFSQETAGLASALKAKDAELREQYAYRDWDGGTHEGIDVRKINALEAEMRELKDRIYAAAQKYGIPTCSHS